MLFELLNDFIKSLDRVQIATNITDLCSLATISLDYYRVYGIKHIATHQSEVWYINDLIYSFIMELCLKLTENEMKSFLSRLLVWKDVIDQNKNSLLLRNVVFYQLMASLSKKLRSLFVSSIGLFWTNLIELSTSFNQLKIDSSNHLFNSNNSATTSQKKRKMSTTSTSTTVNEMNVTHEILKMKAILECIQFTSLSDQVHFYDEVCASLISIVITR